MVAARAMGHLGAVPRRALVLGDREARLYEGCTLILPRPILDPCDGGWEGPKYYK
jgi:hypothetical protein